MVDVALAVSLGQIALKLSADLPVNREEQLGVPLSLVSGAENTWVDEAGWSDLGHYHDFFAREAECLDGLAQDDLAEAI